MPRDERKRQKALMKKRSKENAAAQSSRNGKPFYIAGPHDNVARGLRQLEKTAGPGNFDYVAPMGDIGIF